MFIIQFSRKNIKGAVETDNCQIVFIIRPGYNYENLYQAILSSVQKKQTILCR